VELIASFKNVSWCQIVDPKKKLDGHAVENAGARKKIKAFTTPMGAMQSMRLRR
jgi:hypothetical protein